MSVEINRQHVTLTVPVNPEQEIGTQSISQLLARITTGYEYSHLVPNNECNLPYWLPRRGVPDLPHPQRPYPDAIATIEQGRVSPGAGRTYLQMIRKIR